MWRWKTDRRPTENVFPAAAFTFTVFNPQLSHNINNSLYLQTLCVCVCLRLCEQYLLVFRCNISYRLKIVLLGFHFFPLRTDLNTAVKGQIIYCSHLCIFSIWEFRKISWQISTFFEGSDFWYKMDSLKCRWKIDVNPAVFLLLLQRMIKNI